MTLPTSGIITAEMINLELNRAPNAPFNLGGAAERDLAGVPSGQIAMMNFYGKSDVIPGSTGWTAPGTYSWICPKYLSLTIKCWGGGGAGTASGNGGQTRFHDMLYANGGLQGAGYSTGTSSGGAGGISSGGGSGSSHGNTGEAGSGGWYSSYNYGGRGGAAPGGGGAGGTAGGGVGGFPGGGGGGKSYWTTHSGIGGGGKDQYEYWYDMGYGSGGGGSGAYTIRTYLRGNAGAPIPGAAYTIVIGAGGGGNSSNRGGHGRVLIDWGR